MGDDGERLTALYARFDAITKELAGRDHSVARRGALDRLAANRLLAAPSRQDARPPATASTRCRTMIRGMHGTSRSGPAS